ncbi:MAG TPA: hypothetical protein VEK57_29935 [Thermoanaerobaculia bacterium]|nr:hypothetical protein [Thermoanaerobaculia bacterium]
MKKFVRLLVPLVLLLVAVPSYAVCGFCQFDCTCLPWSGSGTNCKPGTSGGECCREVIVPTCFSDGTDTATPLVTQYTIASVEVITIDAGETQPIRVAEQQQPAPVEIASVRP